MPPHDPLQPHSHEPNPAPPSDNPSFILTLPDHTSHTIHVPDLTRLPYTEIPNCYIVSTGHGTSGPFTFGGVTVADFIHHYLPTSWTQAEVISEDGFGTRLRAAETHAGTSRPILLAYTLDHAPLTRAQGLIRLIVPSEIDDALKQVKWIHTIHLKN